MMEEKDTQSTGGGMPIWAMLILIALLVAGVLAVFKLMDYVFPKQEDPYRVIEVTTGNQSPWKLEIVPAPVGSGAETWLEQCWDEEGYHTFMDVRDTTEEWEGYLYLPAVDVALSNRDVKIQLIDRDNGFQDMMVYVDTEQTTGTEAPENQLLHFIAPEGQSVGQFRLTVDGELARRLSMCVLNGGQMFWAGGEGGLPEKAG